MRAASCARSPSSRSSRRRIALEPAVLDPELARRVHGGLERNARSSRHGHISISSRSLPSVALPTPSRSTPRRGRRSRPDLRSWAARKGAASPRRPRTPIATSRRSGRLSASRRRVRRSCRWTPSGGDAERVGPDRGDRSLGRRARRYVRVVCCPHVRLGGGQGQRFAVDLAVGCERQPAAASRSGPAPCTRAGWCCSLARSSSTRLVPSPTT